MNGEQRKIAFNKRKEKMMALRTKGFSLGEIAKKFGITKQYIFIHIGKTSDLFMKKFRYKCQICGKIFGYEAKKERKVAKDGSGFKYCSHKCRALGLRKLDVPHSVGKKEYDRLKAKLRYKTHLKERKEASKKYHDKNKEHCNKQCRKYYWDNVEEQRRRGREWYLKNKKKANKRNREYYWKNRKHLIEVSRKWYRENKRKKFDK